MKKEDIKLDDIQRILLGEAPIEFLLEVFVRSIITYLILLFVLRLLGKRMSAKLTVTEMAVTLMFGAIVSSAMQIPDRGILQGAFILILVLVFQRLLTLWTYKSEKAEDKVLGKVALMVKDGVMQINALSDEKISRNQLFRLLRSEGIMNLGEVKRLYMETSSSFSIYKTKQPQPGLCMLPEKLEVIGELLTEEKSKKVCNTCGTIYNAEKVPEKCHNCDGDKFLTAVKNIDK